MVHAGDEDLGEALAAITGGQGADGVVETTGNVGVLRQGVDALGARGTLVVVGAPPFGSEVALDVNGLLGGKRIVGLTLGDAETQSFIPALVRLVKKDGSRCTAWSARTRSRTSTRRCGTWGPARRSSPY